MGMSLEAIRKSIAGNSDDLRNQAWTELYSSDSATFIEEINRILVMTDPPLCVLFLRYLAEVPDEKANQYIIKFLQSDNKVIFTAATRAFKKNKYEKKTFLLLPLLMRAENDLARFVIGELGFSRNSRFVVPLINVLEGADKDIKLCIFQALRILPDRRALDAIDSYLTVSDTNLRRGAVAVLCALYIEKIIFLSGSLKKYLSDPDPTIRRTVVWALSKRMGVSLCRIFSLIAKNDEDDSVRQQAVVALSGFDNLKTVKQLLWHVCYDKSRVVVLRAEAALMGMNEKKMSRLLSRCLAIKDDMIRHRALIMLTQINAAREDHVKRLLREYRKSRRKQDRVMVLQSLGYVSHALAIQELAAVVGGGDLVESYVAVTALYRAANETNLVMMALLLQKQDVNPLVRQVLVRFFINKVSTANIPTKITDLAFELVNHPNVNLRYYAALLIKKAARANVFLQLLDTLLDEKDDTVRGLLRETVTNNIVNNWTDVKMQLKMHYDETRQAGMLSKFLKIVSEIDWARSEIKAIWAYLVSETGIWNDPEVSRQAAHFAIMHLRQAHLDFSDVILTQNQDHFHALSESLRLGPCNIVQDTGSASVSAALIRKSVPVQDELKADYLRILSIFPGDAVISYLADVACSTTTDIQKEAASASLRRILTGVNCA